MQHRPAPRPHTSEGWRDGALRGESARTRPMSAVTAGMGALTGWGEEGAGPRGTGDTSPASPRKSRDLSGRSSRPVTTPESSSRGMAGPSRPGTAQRMESQLHVVHEQLPSEAGFASRLDVSQAGVHGTHTRRIEISLQRETKQYTWDAGGHRRPVSPGQRASLSPIVVPGTPTNTVEAVRQNAFDLPTRTSTSESTTPRRRGASQVEAVVRADLSPTHSSRPLSGARSRPATPATPGRRSQLHLSARVFADAADRASAVVDEPPPQASHPARGWRSWGADADDPLQRPPPHAGADARASLAEEVRSSARERESEVPDAPVATPRKPKAPPLPPPTQTRRESWALARPPSSRRAQRGFLAPAGDAPAQRSRPASAHPQPARPRLDSSVVSTAGTRGPRPMSALAWAGTSRPPPELRPFGHAARHAPIVKERPKKRTAGSVPQPGRAADFSEPLRPKTILSADAEAQWERYLIHRSRRHEFAVASLLDVQTDHLLRHVSDLSVQKEGRKSNQEGDVELAGSDAGAELSPAQTALTTADTLAPATTVIDKRSVLQNAISGMPSGTVTAAQLREAAQQFKQQQSKLVGGVLKSALGNNNAAGTRPGTADTFAGSTRAPSRSSPQRPAPGSMSKADIIEVWRKAEEAYDRLAPRFDEFHRTRGVQGAAADQSEADLGETPVAGATEQTRTTMEGGAATQGSTASPQAQRSGGSAGPEPSLPAALPPGIGLPTARVAAAQTGDGAAQVGGVSHAPAPEGSAAQESDPALFERLADKFLKYADWAPRDENEPEIIFLSYRENKRGRNRVLEAPMWAMNDVSGRGGVLDAFKRSMIVYEQLEDIRVHEAAHLEENARMVMEQSSVPVKTIDSVVAVLIRKMKREAAEASRARRESMPGFGTFMGEGGERTGIFPLRPWLLDDLLGPTLTRKEKELFELDNLMIPDGNGWRKSIVESARHEAQALLRKAVALPPGRNWGPSARLQVDPTELVDHTLTGSRKRLRKPLLGIVQTGEKTKGVAPKLMSSRAARLWDRAVGKVIVMLHDGTMQDIKNAERWSTRVRRLSQRGSRGVSIMRRRTRRKSMAGSVADLNWRDQLVRRGRGGVMEARGGYGSESELPMWRPKEVHDVFSSKVRHAPRRKPQEQKEDKGITWDVEGGAQDEGALERGRRGAAALSAAIQGVVGTPEPPPIEEEPEESPQKAAEPSRPASAVKQPRKRQGSKKKGRRVSISSAVSSSRRSVSRRESRAVTDAASTAETPVRESLAAAKRAALSAGRQRRSFSERVQDKITATANWGRTLGRHARPEERAGTKARQGPAKHDAFDDPRFVISQEVATAELRRALVAEGVTSSYARDKYLAYLRRNRAAEIPRYLTVTMDAAKQQRRQWAFRAKVAKAQLEAQRRERDAFGEEVAWMHTM
ncbi:unnamed protein product [Pedinophyceae sp. YPF-701]|nr:unnamed protein product [Pedinophyceae sp. YPF-701]